jgi:hypothetical protein
MPIPGTSPTTAVCSVPALTNNYTCSNLAVLPSGYCKQSSAASLWWPLVPAWQCRHGNALLGRYEIYMMFQSSQHHQAEPETLPELACYRASTFQAVFSKPLPGSSPGCALVKHLHVHSCRTWAHTEGKQVIYGCWLMLDSHLYSEVIVFFPTSF